MSGFVVERRAAVPAGRVAGLSPGRHSSRPMPAVARRDAVHRRALVVADLLAAAGAVVCGAALAGGDLDPVAFAGVPVVVFAAKLMGLYERDELLVRKSTLDELPALLQLATLVCIAWWLITPLAEGRAGRLEVVVVAAALTVLLVVARTVARIAARAVAPVERCLLVGDQESYDRLAEKLAHTGVSSQLITFLPLVERRSVSADAPPPPPPYDALERVVGSECIHRVIVAPRVDDPTTVLAVISRAKAAGVNVSVLPRLFEVVGSSVEFDDLEGMTMLGVRRFGLSRSSFVVKRMVDLVLGTAAVVMLAPVLAVITVAIRIDSPGPVLFRQQRVGRKGRTFTMFKFRSMYDGAHAGRSDLEDHSVGGDGLFKVVSDPRVTPVGRFIRRHSLDELPQLFNVIRGEMSLVGPRPLIAEEDRRIEGWHRRRLELTPGMTGPWQILGRASARVPLRDMVTLDYQYAANWSLWTDAKVLLRTLSHVFTGRGL